MQNSTKARPCVARVHLRGAEFSVYDAACALTAHSDGPKILSASRETLARMTGYSLRAVGFARERLVGKGWFAPITPGDWQEDQRRKSGKCGSFATPKFRVVEHDEWALAHPGQCPTVVGFTAHGQSADGKTEDGASANGQTANTVHGQTADTVHGQPYHNALYKSPKEKPAKNSAANSAAFVVPDWVPLKEWNDWIEMRRGVRRNPTKKALDLAVKKLDELRKQGHDPKGVLENSILNGWAGLFPLKNEGRNQNEQDEERKDETLETLRRIRPPDWEANQRAIREERERKESAKMA